MTMALLAPAVGAAAATATDNGGELIAFWVLAPLALLGAVGMVFSRVAVHSALWLVLTMLCLGCLYIAQNAEFLGFVQIIVYTGAIMMLFLFVLMLTGRDAGDSAFEVLKKQRIIATVLGIGFVTLLVTGLLRALEAVPSVGLTDAMADRGPIGSIAELLFTDYLFPFELTSALLITAATGAMVLTHIEKAPGERKTQRQRVHERMRSDRMSPLPGPGVFATSSSNATPALLPDGSIAPGSVSELVEYSESERVARRIPHRPHADRDRGHRPSAAHRRARPTAAGRAERGAAAMTPNHYLILSALLFGIGAVGFLVRRNAIVVFMCVELMLNAVNLSLVTFANMWGNLDGVIFAFFVMVVAAAEVVVGLAIIMSIFRSRRSASVDDANLLKF